MINLISKIFTERNHLERYSLEFKIFSLKDQYNYWVVASRDNLNLIREEQIELFLKAKEIINEPQFDKNANLLILNKVTKIDEINRDFLLQIEEDQFHFKKSVIYYTEQELVNLNEAIGEGDVVETIERMILEEEVFKAHKSLFDANEFQSLLFRMAHKMPFIKVNITQVNNIESLEEINKTAIGKNTLNSLLEEDFFSVSDSEMEKLTNEEILAKLKTIL